MNNLRPKRIVFITPQDADYGFSLTGVSQVITTEEDAEDTLRNVTAEEDSGLVIIDERLTHGIDEEVMREIEHKWHGVLLVLPAPEVPGVEVIDYVSRMIKRAIGYHVRIRL